MVALVAAPFAGPSGRRRPRPRASWPSAADISGIENYPDSIVARLAFWPFLVLFQGVLTLVVPAVLLLAFWAARQRILEEPGRHLPLLRRVAVVGLSIGWAVGLVHALDHLETAVDSRRSCSGCSR